MFKVLSLLAIIGVAFIMPVASAIVLLVWILVVWVGLKEYKTEDGTTVDIASPKTVAFTMAGHARKGITITSHKAEEAWVVGKHLNAKSDVVLDAINSQANAGYEAAKKDCEAMDAHHARKMKLIKAKQERELKALKAKYIV